MKFSAQTYGTMADGTPVMAYTLENASGMLVEIINLGGIVTKMLVPDRDGNLADVVLGRANLEAYQNNAGYLGALVGRNSNRIAGASFSIGAQAYQLDKNDGENNLHGGDCGLSFRVMNAELRTVSNMPAVFLSHTMSDMSDGFPGNLTVNVAYVLTDDNALMIDYRAVSDKDTMINLTNHSYFNLAGHDSGPIHDQILQLEADFFTPNRSDCVPNGEIRNVQGTPFDFRSGKPIGQDIHSECEQVKLFGGYDHNFVLNGSGYRKVASIFDPASGRVMDVHTSLPGIQLYTGNGLNPDDETYKDGAKYGKHQALCLETQFFPNAVQMPWLASPLFHADEEYASTTTYHFTAR